MSDKDVVINALNLIINQKESLQERKKDFYNNELGIFDRTCLYIDRYFIISGTDKWASIPLMLAILDSHLAFLWEYLADSEWENLINEIILSLSELNKAVESEDRESAFTIIKDLTYLSGNILYETIFSCKRTTIPEEWETEQTLALRIDSTDKEIELLKNKLDDQQKLIEFLFDRTKM